MINLCYGQQTQTQHHQQQPQDPFRLHKLTDNLYALYGRGGNVGFYIGPDSVLVIDSQYRDLAPGIVEKIKSVTDKPITYLCKYAPSSRSCGREWIHSICDPHCSRRRSKGCWNRTTNPGRIPGTFRSCKKGGCDSVKWLEEQDAWAKIKIEEIAAPSSRSIPNFACISALKRFISGTHQAHTNGDASPVSGKSLRWFIREIFSSIK